MFCEGPLVGHEEICVHPPEKIYFNSSFAFPWFAACKNDSMNYYVKRVYHGVKMTKSNLMINDTLRNITFSLRFLFIIYL